MGLNIRDWPLLLYIMLFAGPIAIAVVSVYEWLDWTFGKFGREVPKVVERVCIAVVDTVSIPVPDMADAIPEEA